ncbi:macro domain-containing protein [Membranihabitans maritimus]|uniref:macro domain-containing protein n=1 Tax=Membranihabitans maritimus TaxID=2904244 RepID=UPI001F3EEEB2|nr:macro domain-containing protein [Membranihabitans maritimus]
MKKDISGVALEITLGNIASQTTISAIVNAANAQLQSGGGVAGAIHRAAGPGLEEECRSYAPIQPGQAVVTSAHNLPNKYVIHVLGPVYGKDIPADKLLSDCYKNALVVAENHKVDSIAFPAISTGIFGYPVADAARVAFSTLQVYIPRLKHITKIKIVLFSETDLTTHKDVFHEIFD